MESFGNYIIGYKLINIQSWDDTNTGVRLASDRVNVIIGRNETGKSVLFKVFRQMCFPNFYGRNGRSSLIREGCDNGQLIIFLSNGTKIHFIMLKTNQVYGIKTKDDNETRFYKQSSLPEEIRQELGWYIDEENKILLNVIDNEQGLAFVDTPSKFNASILKFVTEDPQLEAYIKNLSEQKEALSELADTCIQKSNTLKAQIDVLPVRDTLSLEHYIEVLERGKELFTPLSIISQCLNGMANNKKPTFNCNTDKIEEGFETINVLWELQEHLGALVFMQDKHIEKHFTLDIDEFEVKLDQLDRLTSTLEAINKLENIEEPVNYWTDLEVIETLMERMETLTELQDKLEDLRIIMSESSEISSRLASVNYKIESEFELCPLCGCMLKECDHNEG